jgi:hypothetical protein
LVLVLAAGPVGLIVASSAALEATRDRLGEPAEGLRGTGEVVGVREATVGAD